LPHAMSGAQRASYPQLRVFLIAILASMLAVAALGATAPRAEAAGIKVVVVVGPVGSKTAEYKDWARALASQARTYGAAVTEIYSPYATWSKVKAAAAGAKVLIYLGHGNGWPSPYGSFNVYSKDGMGLNATSGNGNSNHKYYGEYYMERLGLAPNAVVMLNRLCYASGNSEWSAANPTKSTAIKRVDNYGYGFLKGGGSAVFASGITRMGYVLKGLFTGSSTMTMAGLFWTDPKATNTYKFSFESTRITGVTARMDPYATSRYYRSVIGKLGTTMGTWRSS
jgi:hypothetical protein